MKDLWVAPNKLFDGDRLLEGHAIRLIDGMVAEVDRTPKNAVKLDGCLTPGFVDLQVNGGGGVLLNTTPTREGIATIADAHRSFGTVAVMPTVITDAPEILDQAAEAAMSARDDDGIVGLHIEGPHISVARRGTHDPKHIRNLDSRTMDIVSRLRRHDVTVMITIAPEAASPEQIAALSATGAIVSLGHTDADAETTEAAIAAGAQCATHLFNAMSPMTSRAPGAVGTILNSTLRSGIICDGHHVDDRMIALALRARPAPDLMFLVSDAMATVGGPDHFVLYGRNVHLEDGRLINEEGSLAGAHVTQSRGVARLVHQVGTSLEMALRMAVTTPARVVGHNHLRKLVGQEMRNLVVLSEDLTATRPFTDALSRAVARNAAE